MTEPATEAIAQQQSTGSLDARGDVGDARSLWSDAWRAMRRNPMFWISATMIAASTKVASPAFAFSAPMSASPSTRINTVRRLRWTSSSS